MSTETLIAILGRAIYRGFRIKGSNNERGSFPHIPPRSMTEEERKYYAIHKHL